MVSVSKYEYGCFYYEVWLFVLGIMVGCVRKLGGLCKKVVGSVRMFGLLCLKI